jgi:hypothetical protein
MVTGQLLRLSSATSGGVLDITFAVVLHISSSRCCYRLYERSFSYYAPNSTKINDTLFRANNLCR